MTARRTSTGRTNLLLLVGVVVVLPRHCCRRDKFISWAKLSVVFMSIVLVYLFTRRGLPQWLREESQQRG